MLEMTGISKSFPGVQAVRDVDCSLRGGEVHALMGQNGAGKSTLIKVLTGVYPPDRGMMMLDGRPLRPRSPADAQRRGVRAVYQELNLIPTLSVAENLLLGRLPRRWWGIDRRSLRRRAAEILAPFDLRVDVRSTLAGHSAAVQQIVAIARTVDAEARMLVLDEPTSSLDARETQRLFEIIRRLRERGLGVLFITHFLEQVYEIADRITVLRNGRGVGTFDAAVLPRMALVEHMLGHVEPGRETEAPHVGRPSGAAAPLRSRLGASTGGAAPHAKGAPDAPRPLLAVRGLTRRGAVGPFDLDIHPSEVVGLAGLLGSGRTEAARLIFGADRPDSGGIELDERPVRPHPPRRAIALGLAMLPEDRKSQGLFEDMSVRDNIVMVVQRRLGRLGRFGLVSHREQQRIAAELVERLGIATPDLDRPVRVLSGGNQQKVILARWLACRPRLLILDEPTRGIDVGAKAQIERWMERLAGDGMAILFISAELDELARRCDRVAVMRDRRKVGELAGEAVTERAMLERIAHG
jgi:simple sugar transport system ATP-binding protein